MRTTVRTLTWITTLALLAGLTLTERSVGQVTAPAGTQEVDAAFRALDPKTREIVETYLRTDCELGEEGKALDQLGAVAEQATPYLRAVVKEGPPSPVRTGLERSLEKSWAARQRFLRTQEARELGEEAFQMMQAITRDDYLRTQRESLDAKYRERAALALRRIEGGADARPPSDS